MVEMTSTKEKAPTMPTMDELRAQREAALAALAASEDAIRAGEQAAFVARTTDLRASFEATVKSLAGIESDDTDAMLTAITATTEAITALGQHIRPQPVRPERGTRTRRSSADAYGGLGAHEAVRRFFLANPEYTGTNGDIQDAMGVPKNGYMNNVTYATEGNLLDEGFLVWANADGSVSATETSPRRFRLNPALVTPATEPEAPSTGTEGNPADAAANGA
jgi:hypothetical protein